MAFHPMRSNNLRLGCRRNSDTSTGCDLPAASIRSGENGALGQYPRPSATKTEFFLGPEPLTILRPRTDAAVRKKRIETHGRITDTTCETEKRIFALSGVFVGIPPVWWRVDCEGCKRKQRRGDDEQRLSELAYMNWLNAEIHRSTSLSSRWLGLCDRRVLSPLEPAATRRRRAVPTQVSVDKRL